MSCSRKKRHLEGEVVREACQNDTVGQCWFHSNQRVCQLGTVATANMHNFVVSFDAVNEAQPKFLCPLSSLGF